jgi:hypothetical protein
MSPNFQNMLSILSLTETNNDLAKKKIAACKRILCAGQSSILAKKCIFKKFEIIFNNFLNWFW